MRVIRERIKMYYKKDIPDSVTICMYIALKCVIRIIDQVR